MAQKPKKLRWKREGHTEAKHRVLTDYLDAWIPILAHNGATDLILIDAFAGPGTYEGGEKGSPLLMLDAFLRREDRSRLGVTAHYFFIEGDKRRAEALRGELDKRTQPTDATWEVIEGDYEAEFPRLLQHIDQAWPKERPPMFAFVDPFGAEQNKQQLASQLLELPQCELLMFVPIGTFARLITSTDLDETLDNLYETSEWRQAREMPDLRDRMAHLVDLLRVQLGRSCKWVRAFEITPLGKGTSYFLFFGTNSKLGLTRMKDAMWKLDPVAGQRFKDSTTAGDPVLFEPEPNLAPLLRMLRAHFGTRVFSIEEAEDFTLFETPFRHNGHLKKATLAKADADGVLETVDPKPGRRPKSFPARTTMRFREG